jgi:hypothetical protein
VLLLDDPERAGAAREDVQAPVLHALQDAGDLHRAARLAHAVLADPDDAELALALEHLGDHRPVALLEDVQRHVLVGQRDEAEREQREVLHHAIGHRWELYAAR